MRKLCVIALLTLTACGPTAWTGGVTVDGRAFPPAQAGERIRMCNLPGGNIQDVLAQRRAIARSDQQFELCGYVASAHTTFFSLPNVCAAPGTEGWFHGASSLAHAPMPAWNVNLTRHYGPWLTGWFNTHAAHLVGNNYAPLPAEEIAARGEARICNDGE